MAASVPLAWFAVHVAAAAWIAWRAVDAPPPPHTPPHAPTCGPWWADRTGFQAHALAVAAVAAVATLRARPCRRTHVAGWCGCVPSRGRLTQRRARAALATWAVATAVLASARGGAANAAAANAAAAVACVAAAVAAHHLWHGRGLGSRGRWVWVVGGVGSTFAWYGCALADTAASAGVPISGGWKRLRGG